MLKDVMLWAGSFLLLVESAKALRLRYAAVFGSNTRGAWDAEWESAVSIAFSPDLLPPAVVGPVAIGFPAAHATRNGL